MLIESVDDDIQEVIANDETGIPDKNLYVRLLKAADRNSDEIITNTEVEALENFSADFCGISNLQGISYCKNLKMLSLVGNNIIDIGELSSLTNLSTLYIQY